MEEVAELLRTWELPDLIPKFAEQAITVQALSALTPDDVKDLIPQIGPRVLFMRCWRTWKAEFSMLNNVSFSGLDLTNIELEQELPNEKVLTELIIVPNANALDDTHEENENVHPSDPVHSCEQLENLPINIQGLQSGVLECLLKKSLETCSLLIYKGDTLDGDATRNLLASTIAKEILNQHKNSTIVGPIYFKWANHIKELFPGERTTTYYIPACTTASGTLLQARGKLVHQVLNIRRRLQQLGALTTKRKRPRVESPGSSTSYQSSTKPFPDILNENDPLDENVEDDLQWLRNSSEPWSLVEIKWKNTFKQRSLCLYNKNSSQSIESYFNEYPALRKPQGYILLNSDFDAANKDKTNNLFTYFPTAKTRILNLLKNKKSKDSYCQELICLADSSNEEEKNIAAFLSIPHLINTTTVKHKVERSSTWKPSKAETRDAFIKYVKSDAEITQSIELRLRTLIKKGVSSQPYIIIVGESLKKIKSYLVIINKSVIYETANIIQAVDTCYKTFWAINAEYSVDSYAIWYFIQRGFYKMTSKFDKGSTSVESLLTDCSF